jgi:hypothetical protein
MTNAFTRGSAPGRARWEDQRPGSFKKDHKKLGGRQRGTPNAFSTDYKMAIVEAAYRVGEDAAGTLGVVGYFRWIARSHPQIMCRLLCSVMELQELETGLPEKPRPTMEELDEQVRAYIGLGSGERTQPASAERGLAAEQSGRKNRTPRQAECAQPSSTTRGKSQPRTQKQTHAPDPESPWAWTGQDFPVGFLMHLAITDPKEFCTLIIAGFFKPPTRLQRGLAARRAWEQRQRVGDSVTVS